MGLRPLVPRAPRTGTIGPIQSEDLDTAAGPGSASTDTDTSTGLSGEEAARRLERTGPNELPTQPREGLGRRILRQIREPMALLLLVAAAVSGLALGERLDAVAILAIVVLNAVIGLVQEGRAARALEALRSLDAPEATVVRDGSSSRIPAADLVPGDVVVMSAGDRVPADLEIVESTTLEVDESMLTGESLPVRKDSGAEPAEGAPVADRPWAAFMGTLATRGAGRGVITETGERTELGRIATRLREPERRTPLQAELGRLTARLGIIAVVIATGVFALTLLRTGVSTEGLERAFLGAVALAVAAVPEGLATVVTVALALGVRRMAQEGAIVRRLPAVETLGSATLLLTDKTGTLTENRMVLEGVLLPGRDLLHFDALSDEQAESVARVAVLASDATLDPPTGDPLEIALLEAVGEERVRRIRGELRRVAEAPFDSQRKRMSAEFEIGGAMWLAVKGAPETVLDRCREVVTPGGEIEELGEDLRRKAGSDADELANRGMRTLALAERPLDGEPDDLEEAERDLRLVGLVALRDPIRSQAAHAVREARSAGVELVMVTGDHAGTAANVASEVGLQSEDAGVHTGRELQKEGVPEDPLETHVYARVDPDQKLALVEAGQNGGHVVAVTGDGVNDAPALRRADIGVAMGRAGSDVAREAADLVVTDDDLSTIVTAIREGRGIYDNIRKVVDYLVAGNFSEIAVVVGALLLFPALGVPLFPLQLLWINLLTDGLPALALGVDAPAPDLMTRQPRSPDERLLGVRRINKLLLRGLLIAASTLGALALVRFGWDESWDHARAVMFTVLVAAHLLYAFAARWPSRGFNPWLYLAIVAGIGLQVLVVVWPAAHDLFGTAFLLARDWLLVAVAAILPTAVMIAIELVRGGADRRSP